VIGSLIFAATFVCSPIAVWDGDGPLWCAEGQKIRISGIAARELDGICRAGHPCPVASGIAARHALVELVGEPIGLWKTGHVAVRGPRLQCTALRESYGRVVARCRLADGRDLATAMIATRTVLPWRD
jgi:endonuclease YncB( thermonuclease family)